MSAENNRLVPIAGSHNLRDLGGYRTSDGRETRWGVLYRSGLMAQLTDQDRDEFRNLGIVAIYDLRANGERKRKPTRWHQDENIDYHSRDYELSVGALDDLIRKGDISQASVSNVVHDAYRELPFEQASSYRELFRLLAAGKLPLLFNCTAGKDRTGIAAALILFALGVPRETIEHDYSLTELWTEKLVSILLSDPRYAPLAALPAERYLAILRADPAYLAVAFTEMERLHGSVSGYLEEVLGVGPGEIEALKQNLLR